MTLLLIWRSSRTSIRELGRDGDSGAYHDVSRHRGLDEVPGVLVARVDGPLFFADADRFRTRLRELTSATPGVTRVVVDAEAVHLTDTDGADIVVQVAEELADDGIALTFAAVHPPVLELWTRAGVLDAIGAEGVTDTLDEAIFAGDGRAPAGL